MAYAAKTKVPVVQSQGEIRKLLLGHGASEFASGERMREKTTENLVGFMYSGITIQFSMVTPNDDPQEQRRMWRSFRMAIYSKLESVQSGISTFEEEFLSWVVTPNGQTIGKRFIPQLGRMEAIPKLLPGVTE